MKQFLRFGSTLFAVALLAAVNSRAANVQFDASTSSDFNVATNWADDTAPTADGDIHFIDNGLSANLTGTATVSHVVVGDLAMGTLNVNGGTLNISNLTSFPGLAIGSLFQQSHWAWHGECHQRRHHQLDHRQPRNPEKRCRLRG
jgi:hypothetical protein